mmetsp:Transcript_5409/g.14877  ORF Transcript_5409/g.14877 Transcript_5409/m.14877 type:complete len:321 (+) Transcript_5409:20-982(+)
MGNASTSASGEDVIILGCVAYSEEISTIWEGMRQYFLRAGVPFDFVMFTSYDRQMEALVNGHIDIAWNGPLAHVRLHKRTKGKCISMGMRDCDRDFSTHLIVPKDSPIQSISDLRGKRIATGAYDSPQAYLMPLQAIQDSPDGEAILKSLTIVRFDRDLGKHGDTAAGELEVLRALSEGEVEAGFVSDVMWQRALAAGDVNQKKKPQMRAVPGVVPAFDHCQFDAMPTLSEKKRLAFANALFAMSMADPDQKRVMKSEGIRDRWMPHREEGYQAMHRALASEEPAPFPGAVDTEEKHRFAALELRPTVGFPNTKFVRACT